MASSSEPDVAFVLPNHNGKRHLNSCLTSLANLDYPKARLSIIVVDNGSVDGSVEYLVKHHPTVKCSVNETNLGFSAACNAGAALATEARIVVFLNNDMRVEPMFLRELLQPIVNGKAQCTAAKILSWDGTKIDFAGGGMAFHGIGFQRGYEESGVNGGAVNPMKGVDVKKELDGPILFACGGAMAIEKSVFDSVGGFDSDFFAYYEDADLGWRLWILGHTVHFAPKAICYHHHSATARAFPAEQIRMLQVRNPLLTVLKNYEDASVERVLAASCILAANRALHISGIDRDDFRIEREESRPIGGMREVLLRAQRRIGRNVAVSKIAIADLVAMADVAALLPRMVEKRQRIQSARVRKDSAIAPLFLNPFWCVESSETFQRTQRAIEDFFRIRELFPK